MCFYQIFHFIDKQLFLSFSVTRYNSPNFEKGSSPRLKDGLPAFETANIRTEISLEFFETACHPVGLLHLYHSFD